MHIDQNVLLVQLAGAVILPRAQEYFKNRPWMKLLDRHTDLRNKATAFVAALASVGIAATFDGTLEAGGKLVIVIPAMHDWMMTGALVVLQYYAQKGYYHGWIKPGQYPAPQEPPKG